MSSEDNLQATQQQPQVNLGQLFSDVSRTVSGFRNILGQSDSGDLHSNLKLPLSDSQQMPVNAGSRVSSSSSPLAGLFGTDTCFKTCGMEDIQWAAKRAGELFMTLRTCAIVMTVFAAIVVILLSILVIYLIYKQYQQAIEYPPTSACIYTPNNEENTSAKSSITAKRPFFSNALFHRRNERVGDEQKVPDQ